MIIEIHGFPTTSPALEHDHVAEVVARAIGQNDTPASEAQRAAHRNRQNCSERFMTIESKEIAE